MKSAMLKKELYCFLVFFCRIFESEKEVSKYHSTPQKPNRNDHLSKIHVVFRHRIGGKKSDVSRESVSGDIEALTVSTVAI